MTIRGKVLTVIVDGNKMMEVACQSTGPNNLSVATQRANAEIFDLRVINLDKLKPPTRTPEFFVRSSI